MDKKYYADVFTFTCPNQKCRQINLRTAYYFAFETAEIGAARRNGLFTYCCACCGLSVSSDKVLTHGKLSVVSKNEALEHGISWEGPGPPGDNPELDRNLQPFIAPTAS